MILVIFLPAILVLGRAKGMNINYINAKSAVKKKNATQVALVIITIIKVSPEVSFFNLQTLCR